MKKGFIFITITTLAAHFAFSWMGFCPTDDGLNQAFSRRILEGQVPHRDFIDLYPIGSALLHAPFVFFGGDRTFWISRLFVWFQFACIAWAWTTVMIRSLKGLWPAPQKILLALIAFMFTSNLHPVMAWYTIDGLFFLSLGLVLCLEETPRGKPLGYALMGVAYLCKQSYLPAVLAFPFILGDWRRPRLWLAAATPGILYAAYLLFAGALPDGVFQLSVRANEFFPRGVKTYLLQSSIPWGILLGYFAMRLSFGQTKRQKSLGAILLYGIPFAFSMALSLSFPMAWRLSFGLFGTALGATGYLILQNKGRTDLARAGMLALLTGWSVSLSNGCNNPALAAGPLAILLVAYCHRAYQPADEKNTIRKLPRYLLNALLIVSVASYGIARQKYIYRDRPAAELTKALDGLFPGTRLIKTNPNTYEFLVDFKEAVEKTKGLDFAVIPGLPAYWVKSSQKNPLPLDWVTLWGEMANKRALIDRVLRDLDKYHGKIVVLLQKVEADHVADGFTPLPLPGGEIQRYVRAHFTKRGETRFFELYQ